MQIDDLNDYTDINEDIHIQNGGTNKQEFLGAGAFGCTFKPGLDCNGKTNKNRFKVNKIQELDFYSKNEVEISEIVKTIKRYKNRFVPVNKACIVKFNKLKQSDLFEQITDKCPQDSFGYDFNTAETDIINKEYYMFYMRYIKGTGLKTHLMSIETNTHKFYNKYFYTLYYLLNSIYILNTIGIIHNDLHYNNIMHDLTTDKPLIIDYGLSFNTNSLYKRLSGFDYPRIKKHFFDWRKDMWWHLNEKRFIAFIIHNRSTEYTAYVSSDKDVNILTKKIVNIFIDDIYSSLLADDEIKMLFDDNDFTEYRTSLTKFYYKFLPEYDVNKKYKYYSHILHELIPYVIKYNDLHSLVSGYINIMHSKLINELGKENNSSKYILLSDFVKQLFKKVLYPDPEYRLSIAQFISIFSFVFKYCKQINHKVVVSGEYRDDFYKQFEKLLNDIGYDYYMFFNKNYAYVDFELIINKENISLIKNFKFEIK
jgi:hypothetical protein